MCLKTKTQPKQKNLPQNNNKKDFSNSKYNYWKTCSVLGNCFALNVFNLVSLCLLAVVLHLQLFFHSDVIPLIIYPVVVLHISVENLQTYS